MRTFKKALLLGALLISASLSVHAAFYKWMDENGVMQYSQSPPPSGDYQEIHSPPPPSRPGSEQPSADTSPAQQDTAAPVPSSPQDDPQQAKQQAARELNCQLAKSRLSELENHPRIRYTSEDGSVRVMGEEEKQAKIIETRKMAEDMCQ
jgi:hypothetical protein